MATSYQDSTGKSEIDIAFSNAEKRVKKAYPNFKIRISNADYTSADVKTTIEQAFPEIQIQSIAERDSFTIFIELIATLLLHRLYNGESQLSKEDLATMFSWKEWWRKLTQGR